MPHASVEPASRASTRGFAALVFVGAALLVALAITVGGHVTAFDESLASAIAAGRSSTLEHMGQVIAAATRPAVLTALVIVISALLAIRRRWLDAGVLLLATLMSDVLAVIVKDLTDRPRPAAPINLAPEAEASFPSGHVVTAATVAFVLVLVFWPQLSRVSRGWCLMTAGAFTLLVSADRLLVGAHWLTDVIAGLAAAAVLIGASGLLLARRSPRITS